MKISADTGKLSAAREWAASVAQEFGLDADGCFAVRLAVSEAVSNAILHGSASPADPVGLEAREESDKLVFEVRDSARGPGMSIERPAGGGRGLGMVALMTDEMQLTCDDAGSVLRFAKRR
jgi:anti-sigma regulatory factor (Ser/Thr protein kinase)